MKKNSRLEDRRKRIPEDIKLFVDHSYRIAEKISYCLEFSGLEQKDLAKLMGKSESEISKWMTGSHNFTLRTISKIEAVINAKLIFTEQQKIVRQLVQIYYGQSATYRFKKLNPHQNMISNPSLQLQDIKPEKFVKVTSGCN